MKNGVIWIVTDKSSSVARVSITSPKKVDITGYNIRNIPEGVVQSGVVYDAASLSEIFKSQLQKVVENHETGEMFLAIPGDRTKTAYLYLEDLKPGELTHANVERIEEAFAAPLTKIRFFPEEETKNGYIFHGIRNDILMPYVSVLEKLGLTPTSVLPVGNCLKAGVAKLVTSPTIVIYEQNGIKLFSATPNSTVVHKLWNVDEIRSDHLRDAVELMRKETEELTGVKPDRVLVLENTNLKGDDVAKLLSGTDFKLAYYHTENTNYIGNVDLLTIKGILTSAVVNNEIGFAANPIDAYELKVKSSEAKLIRSGGKSALNKDYRVAFLSTLLAVVMLVIGVTLLWELYLKDQKEADLADDVNDSTAVAGNDKDENVMGDSDINVIELPKQVIEEQKEVPAEPAIAKSDISVTVLNGNGLAGEAKRVAKLIQAQGFRITKTGNADNYNYRETVVISPVNCADFAEEIKGVLVGDYPLAFVETHEGLTPKVIVVVIGAQ